MNKQLLSKVLEVLSNALLIISCAVLIFTFYYLIITWEEEVYVRIITASLLTGLVACAIGGVALDLKK